MNDFLKRIGDSMVCSKISRGKETGPVSRILSNIDLLVFVYLIVYLFKNQQYFPLIILLFSFVLSFTRFADFGRLIWIGLLIYFVITKYWIGTILILIYGAIGWLSVYFGIKNIREISFGGRANVDPFEGMFDLLFVYILQFIFFGLALLTSGIFSIIFWVLFGFVILDEAMRLYYRLSSPWRRLHFPLMMRYAAIAGLQAGLAKKMDKEFNIKEALHALIKSAYPHMNDDEANSLIESAEKKMISFSDREPLRKLFQKNNPSIDLNKLREVIDKIDTALKKEEKDLYIRYVIAEIVAREYGNQERLNYIYSIIIGQAI